jgi:hypothetical protein
MEERKKSQCGNGSSPFSHPHWVTIRKGSKKTQLTFQVKNAVIKLPKIISADFFVMF